MYSPRRTKVDDYEGLPERVIASPLRAIASPIYQAVKQCKDTVTRDFDRFYDNLQSRLSPRTSDARIRKRTSETADRTRYHLKQKRSDMEDRNRTSLTPLIERHSLREDNKRYNYSTHNPFFQDMESDVAETPSLVEFDMDDTPSTYYTTNRKTSMSTSRLQQQLVEERQRMDRLQKNLSRIKRQSSFLAEELSSAMSMEDHEERLQSEDMIMKTPSRATTEDSRSLDERPLFDSKRTGSIDQRITAFETPLSKQFSVARESPVSIRQTPRKPSSNTPKKSPITPSMNKQKKSPMYSTSPKRNIIEEISTSKLRSTETISTPGGSRISNRFWREIHGLNERKALPTIAHGRVSKPTPKVQQEKKKGISQTWANDDDFWSAESKNAPVASTFNSKLFYAAEQEKNDQTPSPSVQTSFVFDTKENEDDSMSVYSLYKNPLFKAAQQQQQQREQLSKEPTDQPESLLAELESAKKRDEEIRQRNNIPAMNQHLLAELKAKHRAKLIDDSDSYKFC